MTSVRDNITHVTLLILGLLVLTYTYFWGYAQYRYPVPPGDDSLRHMTEAQEITSTGVLPNPVERAKSANLVPDPPLFHILAAATSQVTGLDIVTIVQFLGRFIAILVPFAAYFLARRLFQTKIIALLAFLVLVFLSPQPQQIYNEGNYPNILGAHVFMVFGLSFVPTLVARQRFRSLFLAAIFFIAVFFSHPVSAIYVFLIFSGLLIVYLLQGVRQKYFIPLRNLAVISVIIAVVAVPFVWNYYIGDIASKGITLIREVVSGKSLAEASDALNFIPAVLRAPATLTSFTGFLGTSLFSMGVGGFLLLLLRKEFSGKALFMIWILTFIVGSQTSFFQLPYRFARDLFIPIAIASAFLVYDFATRYRNKAPSIPLVASVALVLLSQMLAGPTNFAGASQYNGIVRLQDIDMRAFQWIRNQTNKDDVFLGSPLVSNAWGSYITLLTGRKVLDGLYCNAGQPAGTILKCDVIYQPNSLESMRFYRENDVAYVFAGHPPLCCLIWKDKIDWNFHTTLSAVGFLDKVFASTLKNVGSVTIFKVNKERLREMLVESERGNIHETPQP